MRERRHALGVRPVYKRVDTCAAEFSTSTAYMYSTYEEECEADPSGRRKIMVLGGGGSTQMMARGTPYIASANTIPQAIGVRGAGRPPQGTNRSAENFG